VTPFRIIHAAAPIRICDIGGWTDTWVARHGTVFNIAVAPLVHVRIDVFPHRTREARVTIDAPDVNNRWALDLDAEGWGPHPLPEAAVRRCRPPGAVDVEIAVHSAAPAGASTGTSAAVVVAMLGALDRLRGGSWAPDEIARQAHAVETVDLGGQSGVQDQLAAALGGINVIEIVDYPRSVVTPLAVTDAVVADLQQRLSLIYLGRPHSSSAVHEGVVFDLERRGPDCAPLASLRRAAGQARDAVLAGDLEALGQAMRDNTTAQAELHASLISPQARRIIDVARAHAAAGWKVNGAGGDGGSIALLGAPDPTRRAAMLREVLDGNPALRIIPIAISREGLTVRDADPADSSRSREEPRPI
jgi:D-glycero-alpha-D-manno-heptose-7-phosphate kinase